MKRYEVVFKSFIVGFILACRFIKLRIIARNNFVELCNSLATIIHAHALIFGSFNQSTYFCFLLANLGGSLLTNLRKLILCNGSIVELLTIQYQSSSDSRNSGKEHAERISTNYDIEHLLKGNSLRHGAIEYSMAQHDCHEPLVLYGMPKSREFFSSYSSLLP